MKLLDSPKKLLSIIILFIAIIFIFSLVERSVIEAQENVVSTVRIVRAFESDNTHLVHPAGLAFSPQANLFFVLEADSASPGGAGATLRMLSPEEEPAGDLNLTMQVAGPVNIAFDSYANRLLLLEGATGNLIVLAAGADGQVKPSTLSRVVGQSLGLQKPQGLSVDPQRGHVFILDAAGPTLIRLEPDTAGGLNRPTVTTVDLGLIGLTRPRGLAFNPANGHLYLADAATQTLYELSQTGTVVAARDLAGFNLNHLQGMVFAPSGDRTDSPTQLSLYLADSGQPLQPSFPFQIYLPFIQNNSTQADNDVSSQAQKPGTIVELSLQPLVEISPRAATVQASLIRVVETSGFVPPSPDPSGIAYLPATDTLLISDSEVNEMTLFDGANLFEITRLGQLTNTSNTLAFTDEPTGVALNPANDHLFVSDDDAKTIYELEAGPDGRYGTEDDVMVAVIDTTTFNAFDPEDVEIDTLRGDLLITDGINNEVYRLSPGSNGLFDGVPPLGDDLVTNFDTSVLGIYEVEGVAFNRQTDTLILTTEFNTLLAEVTPTGTLVRMINISEANALMPAGVTLAPDSSNLAGDNLYIVDRRVDNDTDPSENDGRLYEMSLNQRPVVDAGPDQSISVIDGVLLSSTVSDDALPDPPGAVTVTWSQVSGPGGVTFSDPNALTTKASFSMAGAYKLRLTANDGQFSGTDDVIIVADHPRVTRVIVDRQVAVSSDDAEENFAGSMQLTSIDLDLADRDVGLRFTGVDIPANALILQAHMQFTADKVDTAATSLLIEGEAIDNAATFSSAKNDLSGRNRTGAAELWNPAAWTAVGEAGPAQQTPNLAFIIQEIINRPGWTSGNDLALLMNPGSGIRQAASFERSPAAAPQLHVEYIIIPPNQAPVVNAGSDQTVIRTDGALLTGSVSDDGLPIPPGRVTTQWSQVSGPGTATFANPAGLTTGVTFPQAGIYVLRLTADDGEASVSDDLTLSVGPDYLAYCSFGWDELELEDGADTDCGVAANGKVELKQDTGVGGDVVSYNDEVVLDDRANVTGNVRAEEKVELKKETVVGGNITAGDEVSLDDNALVGGDITSADRVKLGQGSTVGGTITEYASLSSLAPLAAPTFSVSRGRSDITVGKNQSMTLSPGAYKDLKVEDNATLTLLAGVYTFEEIVVEDDASVVLAIGNGTLLVEAVKKIELKDDTQVTLTSGVPESVLFRSEGDKVELGKRGNYVGTYLAPADDVELGEDSTLTGALYGRKLKIKKNADLFSAPAIDMMIGLF